MFGSPYATAVAAKVAMWEAKTGGQPTRLFSEALRGSTSRSVTKASAAEASDVASTLATEDDVSSNLGGCSISPSTLPPTPSPNRTLVLSHEDRRRSKVSFMKKFGLEGVAASPEGSDAEGDGDKKETGLALFELDEAEVAAEAVEAMKVASTVKTFTLMDDSDEEPYDSDDEDDFDFDEELIAKLLKEGADRQKLTCAIEDAMAAAFERKLRDKSAVAASDIVPSDLYASDVAGRMTPGRMTPGRMTPEGNSAVGVSASEVEQRMKEAMELAKARRQKSLARKSIGAASAINQAMAIASAARRQSLATKMDAAVEAGGAEEQVVTAMEAARARHRMSVAKAADVLDTAGLYADGANVSAAEVVSKLTLVQQSVEDARKRHRKSIAAALQGFGAEPEPANSKLNATATEFKPSLASAPVVPGLSETWSSQAQARVQQALTTAYQEHCYSEQVAWGYDGGYNNQWAGAYGDGCGQGYHGASGYTGGNTYAGWEDQGRYGGQQQGWYQQ